MNFMMMCIDAGLFSNTVLEPSWAISVWTFVLFHFWETLFSFFIYDYLSLCFLVFFTFWTFFVLFSISLFRPSIIFNFYHFFFNFQELLKNSYVFLFVISCFNSWFSFSFLKILIFFNLLKFFSLYIVCFF